MTEPVKQKMIQLLDEIESAKDVSRVLDLALQVMVCLSRMAAKYDHSLMRKQETEIQAEIYQIQGHFNDKTKLGICIVTGVIKTVGGLTTFSSAFAASEAISKTLQAAGTGIASVSGGTDSAYQIVNNKFDMRRTTDSNLLEVSKRKRGDLKEGEQRNTQSYQRGVQAISQEIQKAYQAKYSFFRPTA